MSFKSVGMAVHGHGTAPTMTQLISIVSPLLLCHPKGGFMDRQNLRQVQVWACSTDPTVVRAGQVLWEVNTEIVSAGNLLIMIDYVCPVHAVSGLASHILIDCRPAVDFICSL